ncbi:hypothetical protein QAD02_002425 [Eretmocerus hayati]|uniref:Uncharacterized protein n=1 Tax=Eretmocerus hayati TaxID=131215 RepID=A0ACC2NJ89_9HYME|nr:hypothetical protein QAD02_002425 [Eretmocerus hayati]
MNTHGDNVLSWPPQMEEKLISLHKENEYKLLDKKSRTSVREKNQIWNAFILKFQRTHGAQYTGLKLKGRWRTVRSRVREAQKKLGSKDEEDDTESCSLVHDKTTPQEPQGDCLGGQNSAHQGWAGNVHDDQLEIPAPMHDKRSLNDGQSLNVEDMEIMMMDDVPDVGAEQQVGSVADHDYLLSDYPGLPCIVESICNSFKGSEKRVTMDSHDDDERSFMDLNFPKKPKLDLAEVDGLDMKEIGSQLEAEFDNVEKQNEEMDFARTIYEQYDKIEQSKQRAALRVIFAVIDGVIKKRSNGKPSSL